jgi:hypothetical protein
VHSQKGEIDMVKLWRVIAVTACAMLFGLALYCSIQPVAADDLEGAYVPGQVVVVGVGAAEPERIQELIVGCEPDATVTRLDSAKFDRLKPGYQCEPGETVTVTLGVSTTFDRLKTGYQIAVYEISGLSVESAVQRINAQTSCGDEGACVWASPNYFTEATTWSVNGSTNYCQYITPTSDLFDAPQWEMIGLPPDLFKRFAPPSNWALPEILNDYTGEGIRVGVFDSVPISSSSGATLSLGLTPITVDRSFTSTVTEGVSICVGASSHGLFAASLIAAMAPSSTIQLIQVLDPQTLTGDLFTLEMAMGKFMTDTLGMSDTVKGAVLNLSLAFSRTSGISDTPTMSNLLSLAYEHNFMVIAAAGNDSAHAQAQLAAFPARYADDHSNVIGVASSNKDGARSCYSNRGLLAAPGGDGNLACSDISTTDVITGAVSTDGEWGGGAGTSFAAPLVTGEAVLVMEQQGQMGHWAESGNVRAQILCGAYQRVDPAEVAFEYGVVDVEKTLTECSCDQPYELVYQGGVKDNLVASNGAELAHPGQYLVNWVQTHYSIPTLRNYDEGGSDRYFGETFNVARSGAHIVSATLEIGIENNDWNDALGIGFVDAQGGLSNTQEYYYARLTNLGIPEGQYQVINLNLENLPTGYGNTDLIPLLNSKGRLDIVVEDDSAVDYIALTVQYECNNLLTCSSVSVYQGQQVSVAVTATINTLGVFGIQISPAANPSIAQPILATPGNLFPPGSLWVSQPPSGGTLTVAQSLIAPAVPFPVGASGTVAHILYQAVSSGLTYITFPNTIFSNLAGFTLPGTVSSCWIQVKSYGSISGFAFLQGRSNHAGIQVTATGPVVRSATTIASGQYTLTLLPGGSYSVTADAPLFLPNCTTASVIDGQTTHLPNTKLRGGDLNDDNKIDIGDLTFLGGLLGTTAPQADINADGIVNVQDLAITGGNWHLGVDPETVCQPW